MVDSFFRRQQLAASLPARLSRDKTARSPRSSPNTDKQAPDSSFDKENRDSAPLSIRPATTAHTLHTWETAKDFTPGSSRHNQASIKLDSALNLSTLENDQRPRTLVVPITADFPLSSSSALSSPVKARATTLNDQPLSNKAAPVSPGKRVPSSYLEDDESKRVRFASPNLHSAADTPIAAMASSVDSRMRSSSSLVLGPTSTPAHNGSASSDKQIRIGPSAIDASLRLALNDHKEIQQKITASRDECDRSQMQIINKLVDKVDQLECRVAALEAIITHASEKGEAGGPSRIYEDALINAVLHRPWDSDDSGATLGTVDIPDETQTTQPMKRKDSRIGAGSDGGDDRDGDDNDSDDDGGDDNGSDDNGGDDDGRRQANLGRVLDLEPEPSSMVKAFLSREDALDGADENDISDESDAEDLAAGSDLNDASDPLAQNDASDAENLADATSPADEHLKLTIKMGKFINQVTVTATPDSRIDDVVQAAFITARMTPRRATLYIDDGALSARWTLEQCQIADGDTFNLEW